MILILLHSIQSHEKLVNKIMKTQLRTHTCGELRKEHIGEQVSLCGWVQKNRNLGGMTFIDLRDRYGITQLVFNETTNPSLCEEAGKTGREFVLRVVGKVAERSNKNNSISTGEIELLVEKFLVLNPSKVPPFTIEDETDGGEELRMQYRYLDLRRNVLKNNLLLRHKISREVRKYFDTQNFIEIETPVLIKSTPEGARDFVVPSRMNPGQFYALPQSPQTFKQLLMVSGFDRYYQLVRCFRDEDLRADRQPEFTQIDCEMAFIEQEDVLMMFEGLVRHILKEIKGEDPGEFPRMSYEEAMRDYGNDKPDTRFGMKFNYLKQEPFGCVLLEHDEQNTGFKVFDEAETVMGIVAKGCSEYTRKQLDELTEFVKKPQIGANGLIYVKNNSDGTLKSSVDKFYSAERLKAIVESFEASAGDLILILAGEKNKTRKALSELRLEMGNRLGLRDKNIFKPLWVLDFPMFAWDEEEKRWNAMHHPFTSPKTEDIPIMESDPGKVKANAYDLVLNGNEIAGGSIRIHDKQLQAKIFEKLGLSKEEADEKFGFIMNAFEYGAPPHGGIAFGFDRVCAVLSGVDSIRDVIAFPKNNAGRDMMLDAPSEIDVKQFKELKIKLDL